MINGQRKNTETQTRILKLRTWNIRGLKNKEVDLTQEFKNTQLDILALSENKKKGKGLMEINKDRILIYSGVCR